MAETPARRERRVLELLYERGESSAADIQAALDDGSNYSAVRGVLRVLEAKNLIVHRSERGTYLYVPVRPKGEVAKEALEGVVRTFFEGRTENLMATLLSQAERGIDPADIDRLQALIDEARKNKS